MWLIACAFLAIVFGAAGYYVTHQPSQTVVAPTVATTTTSTYVNTAYGYQFDYPSDHTPYSDLDKVNQSLIPAVSTSTMVNIAEIEAQNFCCEPAVIEFSSPFTNPESFPNHARKNVQLNGMPAIEIDGSSTIDSFYRVYFVEGPKDSTGNSYAVTITENTQNAFLDKVLSTFKFTLATSTTSSAPATTTPVAPFGTPPKP